MRKMTAYLGFIVGGVAMATVALAQPAVRDKLVLVVNRAPQELSIYKAEGKTLTPVKKLPIGKAVLETWVSPDGHRAYVGNTGSNSVTVVDLDKLEVVATITHPDLLEPDGGTLSADSKTLYVMSMKRNSVFVVNAVTNKVVKEIPTTIQVARRALVSPDGKLLYVAGNKTSAIGVIDLAKGVEVRTIPVGREPRGGLAFLPDGKTIVNMSVEDDTAYVLDAATGKTSLIIGVPGSPQRLFIAPTGTAIMLSRLMGLVVRIGDMQKHDQTKWVSTGVAPWGMAVTSDFSVGYVANNKDETISILDLVNMKPLATIPAGKDPVGLAIRQ